MKLSKGLLQAYALQDFTFQAALALKEALSKDGKLVLSRDDSQAIKAIVSSWRECQERVAFHRRVPSPGVAKPDATARPQRRRRLPSNGPLDGVVEPEPTACR